MAEHEPEHKADEVKDDIALAEVIPLPPRVAHPWRRTLRTVLAGLPALAITMPLIVQAIGLDKDKQPELYALSLIVLAVSAAATRILAIPQVEAFLQRTVKWLAANDVQADKVLAVRADNGKAVAGPGSALQDGTPVTFVEAA